MNETMYQRRRHNKNLLMIHIVLYNPANAVSDIVSAIKQNSTYRLWAKFSYVLQKHYWKKKTLWSGGYFAASVGQVSRESVEKYIESQG